MVAKKTQIHGFSDASGTSYGCVVYLRTPRCKECPQGDVLFVMAKARLVPLNSPLRNKDPLNTTPKLELMGILLLANLMECCIIDLKLPKETEKFLWSDSTTALQWLSSNETKDVFVFNRVRAIREISAGAVARHVGTKRNPADIVTRQQNAEDFLKCSMWWKGPDWPPDVHDWGGWRYILA